MQELAVHEVVVLGVAGVAGSSEAREVTRVLEQVTDIAEHFVVLRELLEQLQEIFPLDGEEFAELLRADFYSLLLPGEKGIKSDILPLLEISEVLQLLLVLLLLHVYVVLDLSLLQKVNKDIVLNDSIYLVFRLGEK